MTYVVTVETCIPDGAPDLDELGRVGAVVLLERGFGSVAGVEGPDGVEVDVFDVAVSARRRGAELTVSVAAPALEVAEDAVGAVTQEVLDRTPALAEWTVLSSEVRLHTDLARESLAAADGPDVPPSDPAARRARHAAGPGAGGGADGGPDGAAGELPAGVVEEAPDPEAEIRAMAARLRSFDPAVFGTDADTAELAAGALVHASEVLIDELYDDVQALAEEDTDVAACQSHLWHLDRLPARHATRYDELFARRFLVTAVALTTRFTDGGFRRLGCPAEDLVLRFLMEQAHVALDLYGLLSADVSAALDRFLAHVRGAPVDDIGDDTGEDRGTETAAPAFGTWFTPSTGDGYVHPYAADSFDDERTPDFTEETEETEGA
ncbi:hypothetical protein ACIGO8_10035 [Streptomyces sp. NPDC053493]|uniref:hypothetical protein n=1 Tax=Streptomyces sp. NPDC053493 TaxID=3365705 RepID=UPI0037D1A283